MTDEFDNGQGGGQGWPFNLGGLLRTEEHRKEVKTLTEKEPVFGSEVRTYHDQNEGAKTSQVDTHYRLGCGHVVHDAGQWGPSCYICHATQCVVCADKGICKRCSRIACRTHSRFLEFFDRRMGGPRREEYCQKCARLIRLRLFTTEVAVGILNLLFRGTFNPNRNLDE